MEQTIQQHRFENAWSRVRRRVGLVRFLRFLARSHVWVALFAVALVLVLRLGFGWRSGEWTAVAGLLGLWILCGAARSLFDLPSRLESLVLLDRVGGWKDRFSSAWEFLGKPERSGEEHLHLVRAQDEISAAAGAFRENVPLPKLRGMALTLLVVATFAMVPLFRTQPDRADVVLSPEMREAAAEQAGRLQEEARDIEDMDSLAEDERAELEELRVSVDQVARELADSEGLTAGEMLESLEARARASERLAEKLGLADNAWASEEMIAEMARHPDTVDLSLTIEDKAPAPAAEEASKLARSLSEDAIRESTVERFTSTVEQVVAAAIEEDETRPVGERFGNASRKLGNGQPKTAAREFEELAAHFRMLENRRQSRERLEELAESLREAGSEVSGSELERMEKVASESRGERSKPEGLEALGAGAAPEDLQKMLAPQLGQSGAQPRATPRAGGEPGSQGGETEAPVPGSIPGEGPQGGEQETGATALRAPVPGEGEGEKQGAGQGSGPSDQARDGEGDGQILSAPVPGMNQSESGESGAGLASSGNPGGQQGQGGDQAGTGTAEMVDSETEALAAAEDGRVEAQINEDGESTVRAVEGEARGEQAARSRREIVTDFVAAEEQALDEKSLPMSRKEHVIRYFSAIRRQFEEAEAGE